ncbi:MAG: PBSX family phage terminase large subunit, partial [Galactobacter sp.]
VWRNCLGPLQNPDLFGDLADQVKGNHGAPTATILGRRVHILGASDAKAEKVIRGMTVAGAFVDEVTTIPEEFFTQLLGRMSVAGAKLFGSTNPDNPAHWLRTKFLDRIDELPDWRHWHFIIDDNPSLTEDYKNSIKAEFTGLWYRRFIEGEWVAAEGSIFSMWDPDTHVVHPAEIPQITDVLGTGVDYGTSNATAATMLGLGVDGILYAVDEWVYSGRETRQPLTDARLADRLEAWLESKRADYPRPRTLIADPSAASFRTELATRGVPTTPADNDVLYGIRTMASLLGEGLLKVSSECKNLIREFPGYAWDPKAAAKGEDKPIKVADHSLDSARYVIATTETLWSNRVRRGSRRAVA